MRTFSSRISWLAFSAGLWFSAPVWADQGGTTIQYNWVKETTIETAFRAEMGFGSLDRGLTGSRGTPVTNFFGMEYALIPNVGVSLGVPLAGTLSGGDDDYGIGNILLGGKMLFPMGIFESAVGLDMALPSAGGKSVLGTYTRHRVWYVEDQVAISPYFALTYPHHRMAFTADVGFDVQIFTDTPAGLSRAETLLSYDVGGGYSFHRNLWVTVEFGGYSPLTYPSVPEGKSQFYAGPGIRYQDKDLSAALTFSVPFRTPAIDVIDFMATMEVRILF